jgi:hypothetical protein
MYSKDRGYLVDQTPEYRKNEKDNKNKNPEDGIFFPHLLFSDQQEDQSKKKN